MANPTNKITPFLWFENKLEEAIHFYTSVFKNAKILSENRIEVPGAPAKIVTATFEIEGQQFMALEGGPQFKFTPAVSFFVKCKTQEEVDELWEKLSEGGRKDRCGWLQDKYGLSWQVIPDALGELMYGKDPERSKRVMNAMMQMDKIIIKDLQSAYDGK